ncbi:uncharacterized protein LOC142976736 [Anticarsia gemmatalis]|uniref:uncharacterized protein LOC142976736 n=1 Tax=Anticarsia gemmatalis TaxID=129554 RepID=UPI003F772DC9
MEILQITVQLAIISQSLAFDFESIIQTLPPEFPQDFKNKILDIYSKHPEHFGGEKAKPKLKQPEVTKPKTLVIRIPKEFRKREKIIEDLEPVTVTVKSAFRPEVNTIPLPPLNGQSSLQVSLNYTPNPILPINLQPALQTNPHNNLDPNKEFTFTYKETPNNAQVIEKPHLTQTIRNVTKSENITYSLPSSILILKIPPISLITNNGRRQEPAQVKMKHLREDTPEIETDEPTIATTTEQEIQTTETMTTKDIPTTSSTATPSTSPCPVARPMPPPIPYPIPIPIYPQMPIVIPMRTYYEPVIHNHPSLDKIRKLIKKDEERWEKFKKKKPKPRYSSSSYDDSEYTDYGSWQYYEDFIHIKGH